MAWWRSRHRWIHRVRSRARSWTRRCCTRLSPGMIRATRRRSTRPSRRSSPRPGRPPSPACALPAYYLIAPSECSSNLARFDGMRYGLRVGDDGTRSADEVMSLTRAAGFGPEVKRRIMLGAYALSSGYYDAYYGKAQQVRTLICQDFDRAFEQVDVLVSPTTPTTAFPIGERADDPMAMYLADLCTIPSDLAGNAAISVPCGLAPENGLPVGLQVMAPALADDRCYRVAAAVEAALEQRWAGPLLARAKGLDK